MPLYQRPTTGELSNALIASAAPPDELSVIAQELIQWEYSPERREMLDGDRYYRGDHDILQRKRTMIGREGKLQTVDYLPNNRIVDNQYAKHVDQKCNYLLGKPLSFACEQEDYTQQVQKVLGKRFLRTLRTAGMHSLNCGISWLYPYYDQNGTLLFRVFPGYEVLPFWKDQAHTELDMAARLYMQECYIGKERRIVKKVELYKPSGVSCYTFEHGILCPDKEAQNLSYVTLQHENGTAEPIQLQWARLPLIPVKYNSMEIPLIRRARSLQDTLNLLQSDFANNMQEDVRNTILVISNHEGTDLQEFRHNIATMGAVCVQSVDGVPGGVEALHIEVSAENYKTVLELLKKALVENMRSYDAKDDRMSGSPNQMNIQSMYSDMDLDANAMETELQAAFEELLWFVTRHLENSGAALKGDPDVSVIFNRDILINESEAIDNCLKSGGVISKETIVGQHPWTKDPAEELKRLEAETQLDDYADTFEAGRFERSGSHVASGTHAHEE